MSLHAFLLMSGCDGKSVPPPPPPPAISEVENALESIDEWLNAAQPQKAETIARAMVSNQPELAAGHNALGRVLLVKSGAAQANGMPDAANIIAEEALLAFQNAISKGITDPNTIRGAGIAAEQAGKLDVAIDLYRSASNEDDAAKLYLGLALLRNDDVLESRVILEELLSKRPNDPMLHASLAECYSQLGRNDDAFIKIEEAVRLAPDEPAFRIRRAHLLRISGQPMLAAETIMAMPEPFRTLEAATDELSAALVESGRPELAAAAWADHAQANPTSASAAIQTARAYRNAGMNAEANLWVEVVESLNPKHPELDKLKESVFSEDDVHRQVESPSP